MSSPPLKSVLWLRLGFHLFARGGTIVTNEMIDRLREGERRLKRAFLDINVLIALLDLNHAHHRRARSCYSARLPQGGHRAR
jgi:hypothetical protein